MQASEEQRAFLEANRLCVVGIGRGPRAPHLSPVYYVLDGDDILISTTASRFKAKAVRRGAPVSVCVLAESYPFPYLLVEGEAVVEDSGAAELMMKIGARMTGNPVPETARPVIEQRARDEGRVVLRLRPSRFVSTMPLTQKQA
ncbi:MAG TPA: pyridoxamine 5'-phosphate oxidase family protein [Dehalococcoidia bacterium]|nr:pyridoxamine 5'-phosphate oxidase family protein [Dehalococcoidia bacterium]